MSCSTTSPTTLAMWRRLPKKWWRSCLRLSRCAGTERGLRFFFQLLLYAPVRTVPTACPDSPHRIFFIQALPLCNCATLHLLHDISSTYYRPPLVRVNRRPPSFPRRRRRRRHTLHGLQRPHSAWEQRERHDADVAWYHNPSSALHGESLAAAAAVSSGTVSWTRQKTGCPRGAPPARKFIAIICCGRLMRLASAPLQRGRLVSLHRACVRALCGTGLGALLRPHPPPKNRSFTAAPSPSSAAPPRRGIPTRAAVEMPAIKDTIELTDTEQQLFNDLLESVKQVNRAAIGPSPCAPPPPASPPT